MSDLISRQMLLEYIHGEPVGRLLCDKYNLDGLIEQFPPAVPKTGKWIDHRDEGYVECPFCRSATNCDGNIDELHYCFSCGARMEVTE